MLQRTLQALTLACGVAAAVMATPAESRGGCRLIDCLFGAAPTAPSATTYAPPYAPAPAYAAPAPVYSAPACQPCVTAAPSCTPCVPSCTPCVPQTCEYMPSVAPSVVYRPYYAYSPAVVTAYQPVIGSYAVTTYRPFLGTYQTRLVPYTTYRPYYAPAIAYSYSPYASYSPAPSCNSCGGYSSCGWGGCGSVMYGAPSSGCSSCNVASSGTVVPAADSNSNASPPQTFREEKANKPAADEKLEPIPAQETKSSSLPSPALPDPNDRTASRQLNSSARVQFVAQPVEPAPVQDDGGWHAPKE